LLHKGENQMDKYDQERHAVLEATRWLSENGYLGRRSSGGNVSLRIANESAAAITASGRPYLMLSLDDISVVDFDGHRLAGRLLPSIEAAMHIGIYMQRPDVHVVIHTHQPFASLFSIINEPIPALFDEIIVEIGQVVEIIPYAFSGSAELVGNVTGKLGNQCHCYILQNHGALCLGASMASALKNTELLENVARIYYYALTTGRAVKTLPPAAMGHFASMRKLRF
jgi:ribulose-5-phosphate 4-epimerase/fuculose-1-phosphate aldolase